MEINDFDVIFQKILDGTNSPEETILLRQACATQPALRTRLADFVHMERLLPMALEDSSDKKHFTADVLARITETSDLQLSDLSPAGFAGKVSARIQARQTRRNRAWLGIAAILALLLSAAILRPNAVDAPAQLTRTEAAVWARPSFQPAPGQALPHHETLHLRAGMVELDFSANVKVLIQGDAVFQITGPDSMSLTRGRLFADVIRPEGKGFTVNGPCGKIIDLGTRFGVAVDPAGQMEVHVLQGSVKALPNTGHAKLISLEQSQGLRIDSQKTKRIIAQERDFLTEFPPAPVPDAGFILWNFDEPSGSLCANSGRGLAENFAVAEMRSATPHGTPPTRVPGFRGSAIALDGQDDYLESPFKGIPGSGARTVSMWVRIPRDLKTQESYALIGWGEVLGSGTAWQISINPNPNEGPVGSLRAGTGGGAVVGTTELRDDQWHHIAVVMYGGPEASTATHVLLYVDGELESTTRKSIREIDTDTASVDHGIWIGRNLATEAPAPPGANFFRGQIDEIMLLDTALDQAAIRSLMR
jgi:hypothetical protein